MSDETQAATIDGIKCDQISTIMGIDKSGVSTILSVGACSDGGPFELPITDTSQLNNRTVCAVGTETGLDQGIIRTSSGGNWNCGATTVAEITSGDSAYVEMTPSFNYNGNNVHLFIGLGYKDTPPVTSTNAQNWMQWAAYCWAGTSVGAFESGTLVNGTSGGGPNWTAGRSFRVAVDSNVVTIKYSDDGWGSSTTNYTFGTAVDIAGNSNLIAGFALYYAGTHPIENPKIYGNLINV